MSAATSNASQAIAALEAAMRREPQRVPELIEEVGRACREGGRQARLWQALTSLPANLLNDERVLYWRLSCAARLGQVGAVVGEVEAHLREHEAPALRALYAGVACPLSRALDEAERALAAEATPFTLYQVGRLLPDTAASAEVLREAVRLAEREGSTYEMVRNAGALTSTLIRLGCYREASFWGAWALERFDASGFEDKQRRMLLVNDVSYARLLGGERHTVMELTVEIDDSIPELARLYRSTAGDHLLCQGRVAEALRCYRLNYESAPRQHLGKAALSMVRALHELGEHEAMLELAERAYFLTRDEHWAYHRPALLAYGVALSVVDVRRAIEVLEEAIEAFLAPLSAHRLAQACLYLAAVKVLQGDRAGARQSIARAEAGLRELALSGFTLLVGDPAMREALWPLVLGQGATLDLRILGEAECWHDGEPVLLSLVEREIVTLLALYPQGLSLDRLHYLLGERASRNGLKTALSRLRRRLPVSACPYRLATTVHADVVEVFALLESGDVKTALSLYRGPLLADSDAPGIVEVRQQLEAMLRARTLASRDPELLITLAEKLGGDLGLWEAALAHLDPRDARAPIVRARVEQVRRSWRD